MDAPTLNLCKQRITELSAKFDKGEAKKKVTEFAYRDEYGRYHAEHSMLGDAAKGAGVGAAVLGGLYARGKFPGRGRLRAGGRYVAPGTGLGGVVDTAMLGGKHLAGDVSKLWGATAGARTAGAAKMGQLWRQVLSKIRR